MRCRYIRQQRGLRVQEMIEQFLLNTAALAFLRAPVVAQPQGSRLLTKLLLALQGQNDGQTGTAPENAKFVVYVGHDTNIANVAGLLQLSWRQPSYQRDQTPPAGALIFERWTTGAGADRVYVYYTAQSLDDMRVLEGDHPVSTFVHVPGCGGDGSCSLDQFAQLVALVRDGNENCWR